MAQVTEQGHATISRSKASLPHVYVLLYCWIRSRATVHSGRLPASATHFRSSCGKLSSSMKHFIYKEKHSGPVWWHCKIILHAVAPAFQVCAPWHPSCSDSDQFSASNLGNQQRIAPSTWDSALRGDREEAPDL